MRRHLHSNDEARRAIANAAAVRIRKEEIRHKNELLLLKAQKVMYYLLWEDPN